MQKTNENPFIITGCDDNVTLTWVNKNPQPSGRVSKAIANNSTFTHFENFQNGVMPLNPYMRGTPPRNEFEWFRQEVDLQKAGNWPETRYVPKEDVEVIEVLETLHYGFGDIKCYVPKAIYKPFNQLAA